MKKIILGILTLIVFTSCKEYLSKTDLKYMPYKTGDVLVFENKKLNSTDSIKILRLHRYMPDGPQLHFNEGIQAEVSNGKFISVHAGYGKQSESYLKIDNISEKYYIKNLENTMTTSLKIGNKKLDDVIVLENERGIISKIKKVFWSKSKGIVRYETEKGMIWELKIE
jgi:hypothetical protein